MKHRKYFTGLCSCATECRRGWRSTEIQVLEVKWWQLEWLVHLTVSCIKLRRPAIKLTHSLHYRFLFKLNALLHFVAEATQMFCQSLSPPTHTHTDTYIHTPSVQMLKFDWWGNSRQIAMSILMDDIIWPMCWSRMPNKSPPLYIYINYCIFFCVCAYTWSVSLWKS